jgi:hypothetical protein
MAQRTIISVNHARFIQYVDAGGIATTSNSDHALQFDTTSQGFQNMAYVLRAALAHRPDAFLTLIPVTH